VKIKTDEITSVIKQEIEQFASQLEISEVGQVVEVGDGIARVYGLSKVMAGELLEFEGQGGTVMGQAMNLEHDTVGAVLYGETTGIREGDTVRATGRLLEVPVGEGMLGRVVDPLGNPIDGGGDIESTETRKVDIVAPGIAYRQPVDQPLQFGIKAVDSMIPVGRGQRELVIGDRKTGKTVVVISDKFFRPAEVDLLLGDPAKAEKTLGWKAKVDVRGLAQMMAKSDFDALG